MKTKLFFGWENTKWLFRELGKIYSTKKSVFSKKRIVELTSQLQQAEAQVAGQQQDPLIRLKQQEIDLRAMDLQRKAQEAQMKEQGQFTRQEADLALDLEKIKSQEDAQQDRLQLAKEKLKLQAQKQNQPRGK